MCSTYDIGTNKCLKCISESESYLVNGECKPYSFLVIYHNDNQNEKIKLINKIYLPYIEGMYMNNTNISIMSSYTFSSIGNHTIYFFINISTLDSINEMFWSTGKLVSIYFTPKFNTKNIKYMDYLFDNCLYLTSIDLSNLNTENVISMKNLFNKSF